MRYLHSNLFEYISTTFGNLLQSVTEILDQTTKIDYQQQDQNHLFRLASNI